MPKIAVVRKPDGLVTAVVSREGTFAEAQGLHESDAARVVEVTTWRDPTTLLGKAWPQVEAPLVLPLSHLAGKTTLTQEELVATVLAVVDKLGLR